MIKKNFYEENSWNGFRGKPNSKGGNIESIKFSIFCFTVPMIEFVISFLFAVMTGVVCHYIIKWLDGDKTDLLGAFSCCISCCIVLYFACQKGI